MKKLQIDYTFLGYAFPYQKLFHVLSSSSFIKFLLISTLFVRKKEKMQGGTGNVGNRKFQEESSFE